MHEGGVVRIVAAAADGTADGLHPWSSSRPETGGLEGGRLLCKCACARFDKYRFTVSVHSPAPPPPPAEAARQLGGERELLLLLLLLMSHSSSSLLNSGSNSQGRSCCQVAIAAASCDFSIDSLQEAPSNKEGGASARRCMVAR